MENLSVNIALPSFVIGPAKPRNNGILKGVTKKTMETLESLGLIEIDDIRYSQAELKERNVSIKFADGKSTRGLIYKGKIFFHQYFSGSFYPYLFEVREYGIAK